MSDDPKPHEYPLVLVEWHDAYGCSPDWEDLADIDAHPMTCRSVGWMVQDRDDCVVIVPHRAGSEGFSKLDGEGESAGKGCGDMTIPRRAVTRITHLDEQRTPPTNDDWPPQQCPGCGADRTDQASNGNTRYGCGSGVHPHDDRTFAQSEKCRKMREDRGLPNWSEGEGDRMTGRTTRMLLRAAHDMLRDELVVVVGRTANQATGVLGRRMSDILQSMGLTVTPRLNRLRVMGHGLTADCMLFGPTGLEEKLRGFRVKVHVDHSAESQITDCDWRAIEDANAAPIKVDRRGQGEGPIYYSCGARTDWNIHTGRREGRCPAIKEV